MCMKFRTFWKKRRVSYPNIYRNYCNRKRCLLKRLKGLSSAHLSVINVLTCSKHCWSQHGKAIFLFLLRRLKGLAPAHHSVINVLTVSKHSWSQHRTTIFLLFNEIEIIGLENVCLSHIWNFRFFVNPLTTDDKYSCRYMQIFRQQFQTPLSQKEKAFCPFLIAFLKCVWNLEHSEKKKSILP